MVAINLLVRINASTAETFQALTSNEGISKWFTQTHCSTWQTGAAVKWFDSVDMTITDIRENAYVCMHVNSGGGWDNTNIRFSVEQVSDMALVRFDQSGWPEISDHFRDCSMSWAYFLESLRQYLETGKGTPEGVAPVCEST